MYCNCLYFCKPTNNFNIYLFIVPKHYRNSVRNLNSTQWNCKRQSRTSAQRQENKTEMQNYTRKKCPGATGSKGRRECQTDWIRKFPGSRLGEPRCQRRLQRLSAKGGKILINAARVGRDKRPRGSSAKRADGYCFREIGRSTRRGRRSALILDGWRSLCSICKTSEPAEGGLWYWLYWIMIFQKDGE